MLTAPTLLKDATCRGRDNSRVPNELDEVTDAQIHSNGRTRILIVSKLSYLLSQPLTLATQCRQTVAHLSVNTSTRQVTRRWRPLPCGCDKVAQGAFHPRIPIKSYQGSSIEWVKPSILTFTRHRSSTQFKYMPLGPFNSCINVTARLNKLFAISIRVASSN